MTQPTSVNMTFDTSLIDLGPSESQSLYPSNMNTSFSTTESDSTDAALAHPNSLISNQDQTLDSQNQETPKQSQAATFSSPPKSSTPVQHVATQDAYDQWASVYDLDGNMLQSIDDLELSTLLPEFFMTILSTRSPSPAKMDFVDLGCGTGRNTTKLLSYAWPKDRNVNITALDFSKGMLEVAAKKLSAIEKSANLDLNLYQCDCFPTVTNPIAPPMPPIPTLHAVDGLISTLVLEHIPLRDYFSTVAALVSRNGYALVTNMHSEMGRISQAGFVNEQGVKVRGKSFAHTPQESAEEAQKAGFEVIRVLERGMEARDVEMGIVSERGKKWIGVRVWYGLLLRKIV